METVRTECSAGEASHFAQVGVGRGAGNFEEDARHAETIVRAGRREPRVEFDSL